jgi:quercetin dioxygenase-like cupin family protein
MSVENPDRAAGSGLRAHDSRLKAPATALRNFVLSPQPLALCVAVWLSAAAPAAAQAVGGADKARPVAGDPGISSMVVMDKPEFRVLRDYAEPGATRRMHSHDDATWHVFTLVTGRLKLTVEGEAPVDVTQGEVLYLKGGARHTFTNTGSAAATIVEVFGKAPASPR